MCIRDRFKAVQPFTVRSFTLRDRKILVLQTIVLILFVLWLLGTVTSFTLGSMSHILVGAAVIFVVLWFTHRRNPLRG